jgi:hypothetical protein
VPSGHAAVDFCDEGVGVHGVSFRTIGEKILADNFESPFAMLLDMTEVERSAA